MGRPALFLIDGSSQMYRAYHAFRGRGLSNQDGQTTHAVYVFVTMLRKLMIIGVAFASVLVALLLYVQLLKSRHERVAREAQSQTRDILATVKEGLFLIDSDFQIAKAHSAALSALMRRENFDGGG